MFGWLATFGAARREHPSTVQTHWFRLGPQALARTLPTLGSVLHLPLFSIWSLPVVASILKLTMFESASMPPPESATE